jgi:hypothetical protein
MNIKTKDARKTSFEEAKRALNAATYKTPNGGTAFVREVRKSVELNWSLHSAHPRSKEDIHRCKWLGWILESRAGWSDEDQGEMRLIRRRA